jgi:hypothetical protein
LTTQVACPICNGPALEESRFCKRHHRAHEQLQSAFGKWKSAYGEQLDKKIFFERVLQLPDTGQKVKEVIQFLLEKEPS